MLLGPFQRDELPEILSSVFEGTKMQDKLVAEFGKITGNIILRLYEHLQSLDIVDELDAEISQNAIASIRKNINYLQFHHLLYLLNNALDEALSSNVSEKSLIVGGIEGKNLDTLAEVLVSDTDESQHKDLKYVLLKALSCLKRK